MKLGIITAITIGTLTGCASITNDAYVPMALSFSDGSTGGCDMENKRYSATVEIPGTPMIRRSDDNLRIRCKTTDGREATVSVPSAIGAKIVASEVFLDFGINDSITDNHREYRTSFVIPVKPKVKKIAMKKLEHNSPAEEKALKAAMAADPDKWEATEAEFASARPSRPPVPVAKTNLAPTS